MGIYRTIVGDATIAPITDSIDGRWLRRRLNRLNPAKRALLAHDLERGNVHNLTRAQAAALAQVSVTYVKTVSHATAEERELLERGRLTLSALHNNHRYRSVTDADIEKIIVEIGVDRIWSALTNITEPGLPLVAAE